jgi:hypothetical protein
MDIYIYIYISKYAYKKTYLCINIPYRAAPHRTVAPIGQPGFRQERLSGQTKKSVKYSQSAPCRTHYIYIYIYIMYIYNIFISYMYIVYYMHIYIYI